MHPGFVLHLVLEDNEVRIEPEFRFYEEAFLNVFELIVSSAHMVPRVDSLLLPDRVRRKLSMANTWIYNS